MLGAFIIIMLLIAIYQKQNKGDVVQANTSQQIASISIKDYTKSMIKFLVMIGIGVLLAIILYFVIAMLILTPFFIFN